MAGVHPLIGIMACRSAGDPPFREYTTYAAMSRAAKRMGATLAVFSPDAVAAGKPQLDACLLQPNGRWESRLIPYPDVVLERAFYSDLDESQRVRSARACLEQNGVLLLAGKLGGKLAVSRILSEHEQVRSLLPATELIGLPALFHRLEEHGTAFLKLDLGSKGLGCVRLVRENTSQPGSLVDLSAQPFLAEGRDFENRPFRLRFASRKELACWVNRFTAGRRYLVQDYLRLMDDEDRPYDLRSLVQKEASGAWAITGIAVRQGARDGMTANLHGGGKALSSSVRLKEIVGPHRAAELLQEIEELSLIIAGLLEERFGRFVELGLDFGVEPHGRLWFLEANSRPGRSAFRECGDQAAAELSVSRPVAYAVRLASRRMPAFLQSV
ncbi:YheC/YheD family endospore coat-associated protein [Gorillibacterium timonense]|uniref:YheC/YheD family endospore coat-associated protein n=1 Tax=Gorillibacterium timonense TaxID=1689269 RepID=UPI00071D0CA6|nr:YheC/YheD family protein [Gorillibacterium timonense]